MVELVGLVCFHCACVCRESVSGIQCYQRCSEVRFFLPCFLFGFGDFTFPPCVYFLLWRNEECERMSVWVWLRDWEMLWLGEMPWVVLPAVFLVDMVHMVMLYLQAFLLLQLISQLSYLKDLLHRNCWYSYRYSCFCHWSSYYSQRYFCCSLCHHILLMWWRQHRINFWYYWRWWVAVVASIVTISIVPPYAGGSGEVALLILHAIQLISTCQTLFRMLLLLLLLPLSLFVVIVTY